jgi:hypothetical protein
MKEKEFFEKANHFKKEEIFLIKKAIKFSKEKLTEDQVKRNLLSAEYLTELNLPK